MKSSRSSNSGPFALSRWPAGTSMGRRRLLTLSASVGAAALGARVSPGLMTSSSAQTQAAGSLESGHTWLLDSPNALRPDPPASRTQEELDELLRFQADRTDDMVDIINKWASRQAVLPWLEMSLPLTGQAFPPGLFQDRAQSLIRTAMSDAIVAALDAQEQYDQPAPAVADERIEPIESRYQTMQSYPSLHAAVAGAASTVMAFLFPDASEDGFADMATEAAESRLWAGAASRSDIEAGLALGRRIGELAVERGRTDGSDAQWDGTGWPEGDGLYERTPPNFPDPFVPLAGTWTTWVLPSGDALRPAPYPEYGSPAWHGELATVKRLAAERTVAQERIIDYWLGAGPLSIYTDLAQTLIGREQLGEAETALVLSMMSVANFDSTVAVWDAKYSYWIARPITMDPEINLYIPNPPYPSYPAGFPAFCASSAAVLADVFPAYADDLYATAEEGAMQRAWSGIHYVLDNDVGLLVGGHTARATAALVRGSGSLEM
jgi:hypothetical protein